MAWAFAISFCVVGSLIALPLHGCDDDVDVTPTDVNTRSGQPPPPFVRRRRPQGLPWGGWVPRPKPITRAPTPTQAPTSNPTLAPADLAAVNAAIQAFMGSNDMLSQINNAVISQVPNSIFFDDVQTEKEDSKGFWFCKFGYKVSAELNRCSGLNRVRLLSLVDMPAKESKPFCVLGVCFGAPPPPKVVELDSNGNMVATFTPRFRVEGVFCTGQAKATGKACGINMNAYAKEMSAGASVRRIETQVSATVEKQSNGKMCLNVKSVNGRVRQEDIKWLGFKLKFAGLPIGIPGDVINGVWAKLPLSRPINKLVNTLTGTLQTELDKMNLCM